MLVVNRVVSLKSNRDDIYLLKFKIRNLKFRSDLNFSFDINLV